MCIVFFDNYAQFINATLLANEAPPRESIYLTTVHNNLNQKKLFPNVTQIVDTCLGDPRFEFIEDFNNIIKHQSIISPNSRLCLNNGNLDITLPGFEKGNRNNRYRAYSQSDLESKLFESYEFAKDFCITTTNMIYNILPSMPSSLNKNRIHSVYTHIQVPDENIQGVQEVSLRLDKRLKQDDHVYILLARDTGDDIDFINCPYNTIVLKDDSEKIIGMLIAESSIENDDSNLKFVFIEYRKYRVETKNYTSQLIDHLRTNKKLSLGYGPAVIIQAVRNAD